jgi:hypothetical protein
MAIADIRLEGPAKENGNKSEDRAESLNNLTNYLRGMVCARTSSALIQGLM